MGHQLTVKHIFGSQFSLVILGEKKKIAKLICRQFTLMIIRENNLSQSSGYHIAPFS